MRPLIFLLLAACSSQTSWPAQAPADACAAGALPDEEVVLRVKHGGRTRSALVWPGTAAGPRDVVVNLHEFRAEPRRQNHYSGWVPLANEVGAILVGPDGKSATWNAGGGCCGKAAEKHIDDVGVLDAFVAEVDEAGCTSGKVLATGIGNGAMMAHRWACESDTVDAVVSVGGALQLDTCEGRPIPVLHYHGAEDTFYPADGSKGQKPVDEALAVWRKRNHATGEPTVETDGQLTCTTWEGDAPVTYCVVEGMPAMWPGAADTRIVSDSPLAHAARGALEWVRRHW